jgi:hypothetical protein
MLFKNKKTVSRYHFIIGMPLIVFCLFGVISGIANGNPFNVTILGTFDYIKYFLVIFIYAVFFRHFSDFHKIFRFLLVIAVVMASFAILEEAWALVFRYAMGKDILDPVVYLFRKPPPSAAASLGAWRFGIFRAASFIKSTNIFGYYMLFILTIYIFTKKKLSPFICVILIGAVLGTVSRSAYMGLLVLFLLILFLRKVHRNIIIISVVCFLMGSIFLATTVIPDIDLLGKKDNAISYREFARQKGTYIWEDHQIVGAGPGMFGGVVSKMFVSPLYKEYGFPFGYIKSIGGIDQFWPQVFAEVGIIGFILLIWLIVSVIKVLLRMKQSALGEDIQRLSQGLLVFLMVIYVYTFGTGFNTTVILYTYFAFVGIAVGAVTEAKRIDNQLNN